MPLLLEGGKIARGTVYLGKVVGSIVSTIKHEDYSGHKLMIVQPVTPEGKPWKSTLIAVDIVGSGPGETVLYVNEGNAGRQLLGLSPQGAARAVIVGIVDEVELAEGLYKRFRKGSAAGKESAEK